MSDEVAPPTDDQGAWFTPSEAIDCLKQGAGWDRSLAIATLTLALHKGVVAAVADGVETRRFKDEAFTDQPVHVEAWDHRYNHDPVWQDASWTYRIRDDWGGGTGYRDFACFHVRFDRVAVEGLLPRRGKTTTPRGVARLDHFAHMRETSADPQEPATTPTERTPSSLRPVAEEPRGRPAKVDWEAVVLSIARRMFFDSFNPTTVAEIAEAIHQHLANQGLEAGDTVVKERARKIHKALVQQGA